MSTQPVISDKSDAELVPTVILVRGDQVLRREYPVDKFAIGTSEKATLQFQAPGLPELHPFLVASRKGMFVYVRQGMTGVFSKGNHSVKIEDLIALGLLPEKSGLYALNVEQGKTLSVVFGDHVLKVGFGPRPAEQRIAQPAQPARIPTKKAKPKLVLKPNFYFAEIPVMEAQQKLMWGTFAGVGLVYFAMLMGITAMIKYVPVRDIVAPPPPRVVKLIVPKEEPEPVKEEEVLQEETPEETAEQKKEEKEENAPPPSQEQQRQQAKQQVQKLGLIQMLSSSGGGISSDISGVMNNLSNVFAAGALTTNANEADTALDNINAFGNSGGIEGSIAGLKGVGRRKLNSGAEKVDNPVVQGEAAADSKRSYSAIAQIVRSKYMSAFRILYKKLLRSHPAAQGKITFRFTIRADGSVTAVSIVNSEFRKWPDFEGDMKSRVEKMRFEPIPKGDVTVEFPFLFTPAS